jgi:hypothetical protein
MMQLAEQRTLSSFEAAEAHFTEVVEALTSPGRMHMNLSDLEKYLQGEAAELFRKLLQGHLDLRAEGHVQGPVVGQDQVDRKDRHLRSRKVETIFGEVEVERERFHTPGVGGLAPLDAELNLPPERASLSVQRRLAEDVAKGSYDEAVAALEKTTGASVAKRQAEACVRRAAVDFEDFYRQRREVEGFAEIAEAPGSILVMTIDGKGVPMRREALREATRKAAEKTPRKLQTRRAKGEKAHRKRMAAVASVYTVAPFIRAPQEVVLGLRAFGEAGETGAAAGPARPRPEHKRVWANVKEPMEHTVEEMFTEAMMRGTKNRRVVVLLDGNEVQLGNVLATAEEYRVEVTVILDFIHVLEYLWKAGTAFEKEGTRELEEWVLRHMLGILEGRSSLVAGGMRRSATRRKLSPEKRAPVDQCADYLVKYGAFMRYGEYLAAGLPIATGVIEGACRYLVKDRMEITGARWSLEGAEAVLRLRSLRASGDFEEYWAFHEQQEHLRNHASHYRDQQVPVVDARPPAEGGHLRVVK